MWDAPTGFWFIHAYVLLMMLSPMLNRCFAGLDDFKTRVESVRDVMPLLFVVFVWSALLNYNHLKIYVPAADGVTGHGFLCFMGVYAIGRYARLCRLDRMLGLKTKLTLIVALIILSCLSKNYMLNGNTILGVALPVLVFLVIKDVSLPSWLARVVLVLSPLMFAVYCIHGTVYFPFTEPKAFSVIEWTKQFCVNGGMPIPLAISCASLVAFAIGLFFAAVARLIGFGFSCAFPEFYRRVDVFYDSCCARIATVIGMKMEAK